MNFVDLKLDDAKGFYDLVFGDDGDFETVNSFDTYIIEALFTDARADSSQISVASNRRGWHGNEFLEQEQGGLLWLLEQVRLNRDTANKANDYVRKALFGLVRDGFCKDLRVVSTRKDGALNINIQIIRFDDKVEHRNFTLWSNTGA